MVNLHSNISNLKASKMADEIEKVFSISPLVKEAISKTPREMFVPKGFEHKAYKLDALPIGKGQFISSPLTVAMMSEYLIPFNIDKVLEIGCGSGYQAAVLSHLARGVFSIERIKELAYMAKEKFKKLNYHNIHIRTDDGQRGWPSYAPYNRILFSAVAKEIPKKIFEQLSDDGILLAPILIKDKQVITRFYKNGDTIKKEELDECNFVPIVDGVLK